jgi:hypothetical protein
MVVTYGPAFDDAASHEAQTLTEVARAIARLVGQDFGGLYDPAKRNGEPLYFVPGHTLVGGELGIEKEEDFFGGRVPYAFVGRKTIAHPLLGSRAPQGWSPRFAERVREAVLPGFSAFHIDDAREAAKQLLEGGPVRLKPAAGVGSRGQHVVERPQDLDDALQQIDSADGVAIERNLVDVATYSVGQVCVGGMHAFYIGTQSLTQDNKGNNAYGGSALIVVRGSYDSLAGITLPAELAAAVRHAHMFDAAAMEEYPGLIASRRNYDVARGRDSSGREHCGVLEQSWRIGGASAAEIAALTALRDDPDLQAVHASTVERYGENIEVPEDATVLFSGVDARAGALTKFVVVDAD